MKKAIFTCMVMACLLPIGGWAQTAGTLDFTEAESSSSGNGYSWDNENKTLTLEGLTASQITLPDGATVILNGNNTINYNSDGAALTGIGALTIEGDGTLAINSNYEAIHAYGNLYISGGKYNIITLGESDKGSITSPTLASISNSEITIEAATDDGIFVEEGTVEINNSALNISATEEEGIVCNAATINNSNIYLYSGAKEAFEPSTLSIIDSYVELMADNENYRYEALYRNATITCVQNSTFKALGEGSTSALRSAEQPSDIKITIVSNSWVEGYGPITCSNITNSFVRTISTEESIPTTSTVYGTYTLPGKVEIAEGEMLVIPEGATLTIPTGLSLTNNGTTSNNGTLYIESGATLDGTEPVGGTVIDNNQSRPEITYYSLTIIPSEGATLTSRHDKKTVKEGGSFTLSLTIDESYAGAEPTVYVKRGRGEWTALEIDTVSGYYQIRDVRNDITVKVSGDGIYPVGNETVAPQQARIYASGSKIVVVTPQPTEVQIISMSGAVVAACQVNGQQEFGNLANGIYIVRAGNETIKLHVAQ